ncbi:MAG TPA: hypothetical protein P5154_04125 [Candidatus Izemoplasmatales bacterium]|nr:hypothetical protein [Candidatus Izemoplasmatales bacterium]
MAHGKVPSANDWFRLDNAAKIFPAISTERETNTFRVQIEMTEDVDKDFLQLAVDAALERYPMFKVRLKSGLFWNYLDYNQRPFTVRPLTHKVCGPLDPRDNNGYLFQIYYRARLIVLEMFHSLADGGGAFALIKTIVYEYLTLKGCRVTPDNMILTRDSLPTKEEYEDSNLTYYDPQNHRHVKEERAFLVKGTPIEDGNIGLISGTISTAEMIALARNHQASVTEYLTALLMYIIYLTQIKYREHLKENQKPVKIFVPVNLRKHFPSNTLRNFANFVKSGMVMNRADITFDEILEETKKQFAFGLQPKELIRKMSENVSFEKNFFLRITPYFLKKFALRIGYKKMGLLLNTLSFSNLGKIDFPESMEPYIDNVSVAVYSGRFNTINIGTSSFRDKFRITFTRSIVETTIEREFFRHFTEKGIHVTIESNYVEEY